MTAPTTELGPRRGADEARDRSPDRRRDEKCRPGLAARVTGRCWRTWSSQSTNTWLCSLRNKPRSCFICSGDLRLATITMI
ncbi:hypothetical protein TCAL_15342 [Tigriopus californicus]|uniref:Uncharacterized protein n=1 Tax=Tigriopus californicus TaxID=6832 RepID=A0A553PJC1_TIGCA|nr:hypothetical protein TCAL_15342 [Tigriopus californicus]